MSNLMLNLMCCDLPLPKPWINLDISTSPHIKADMVMDCTKLAENFDKNSVDQIYCGHGVEHLTPTEAEAAIEDWKTVLKPGGILCFVTPDFDAICDEYLRGRITLDDMNNRYLYSYVQESPHRSMWNQESQRQILERHGFTNIVNIDRETDERLAYPHPLQCGVSGERV